MRLHRVAYASGWYRFSVRFSFVLRTLEYRTASPQFTFTNCQTKLPWLRVKHLIVDDNEVLCVCVGLCRLHLNDTIHYLSPLYP